MDWLRRAAVYLSRYLPGSPEGGFKMGSPPEPSPASDEQNKPDASVPIQSSSYVEECETMPARWVCDDLPLHTGPSCRLFSEKICHERIISKTPKTKDRDASEPAKTPNTTQHAIILEQLAYKSCTDIILGVSKCY